MQNQTLSNRTMSDTADLLQQLLDIRRKVASEHLSGGKKKRKSSGKRRRRKKSAGKKKRKSSGKKKKIRYATATTRAGRYRARHRNDESRALRQVFEGRADKTCVGGLTRSQLKENKQGKIVSKAASKAASERLRENPALARKFARQRMRMKQGLVRRN